MFKISVVSFGILATLTSMPLASKGRAATIDKIAAVVNADVILQSDLDRFYRSLGLRKELDPLFGLSAAVSKDRPSIEQTLDFLIQERLVLQSFKVSDAEIDQEIETVKRNNNLTDEALESFLNSKGHRKEDYRSLMGVGLSKRALLDREIRNRVNISKDDVRNEYYNTTLKNSSAPLEYSVQMITLNFATYKSVGAAQEAAQEVLRSIKQGESFTEVAKRVSDHPTASSGGELGYLAANQLTELLANNVKKLQINEVSPIIKSTDQLIILKLLDAKSTKDKMLAEKEEAIREKLADVEYKKQLTIWAERARNNAYVRIN